MKACDELPKKLERIGMGVTDMPKSAGLMIS